MLSAVVLELDEPFKIVVENRLNTISPYIFLEQETWFETEVPFFHKFLQPGMRVVDVGTNCGFYTLLAAEKVGDRGHVWGFEPGLKPARLLRESLRLNNYSNVTLIEAAAGPKPGSTWFDDKDVSELSAVVDQSVPGAREVRVESLDNLHQSGELTNIDFIKIDAEGFEDQVIAGGYRFFDNESPLVMLEIESEGSSDQMIPAEMLKAKGYEFYRHYPGLNCLVPLVRNKIGDYLLNIFLCKPDRAAVLKTAGLLVDDKDLIDKYAPADRGLFIQHFSGLIPVQTSADLAYVIANPVVTPQIQDFQQAAAEYLMSQDETLGIAERYSRLSRAERWVDANYTNAPFFAQVISCCRIWIACGRIGIASGMLGIIGEGKSGLTLVIDQPFLPITAKWDRLAVKDGNIFPWLATMVAEGLEFYRSFSSLYKSIGTRDTYGLARQYGYLTPMLERRAALATLVQGYEQFPEPIYITGELPRNQAIWNEIAQRLGNGEKHVTALDAGVELA